MENPSFAWERCGDVRQVVHKEWSHHGSMFQTARHSHPSEQTWTGLNTSRLKKALKHEAHLISTYANPALID